MSLKRMTFNAKEYKKLWAKKNRERVRESQRRYYVEHKEQISKRRKELLKNMDEEKKEELREKRKGYCKKYRDTHKERVAAHKKEYREEHKQEHREENLRSYYRHRDRIMEERREKYNHASRWVNYAIKMGKIKRQPCEICGAEPAEAHHNDYNKPLEVRWLCKECHVNWHKNNKPIYKETKKMKAEKELESYGIKISQSKDDDRPLIYFVLQDKDTDEEYAAAWGNTPEDVEVECTHPAQCVSYDDDEPCGWCELCGATCDAHYEADCGNVEDYAWSGRELVPTEWAMPKKPGGVIGKYLKELAK